VRQEVYQMGRYSTHPGNVASHFRFRLVKAKLLKVRNATNASYYDKSCLNDDAYMHCVLKKVVYELGNGAIFSDLDDPELRLQGHSIIRC